jgi:hypothetical protein
VRSTVVQFTDEQTQGKRFYEPSEDGRQGKREEAAEKKGSGRAEDIQANRRRLPNQAVNSLISAVFLANRRRVLGEAANSWWIGGEGVVNPR